LVEALDTLQELILSSTQKGTQGEEIKSITPFKLDQKSREAATEFEVIFIEDEIKFQYGVALTRGKVLDEYLYAYPEGRPQLWFDRSFDSEIAEVTWQFGSKLKGSKKTIQKATRDNALFLSTAVMLNHEQLETPFKWFKDRLCVLASNNVSPTFTTDQCRDERSLRRITHFMNQVDLSISSIAIDEFNPETLNFPPEFPDEFTEHARAKAEEGKLDQPLFIHGSKEAGNEAALSLQEVSLGTGKLFSLAGPIMDVLDNGYVLIIDELHNNFHPFITNFIIQQFRTANNPKHAQLIFTTHDTFMLSPDHLRRDQVWLTERDNASLEGKLYPLTNFHPRKGENVAKNYLSGAYGAVPFIAKNLESYATTKTFNQTF
jgi:AAA15 family ATPase/GTPase